MAMENQPLSEGHLQTIKDSVVIASDVHLRSENDDRGRLFLEFLDQLSPGDVKTLILLGDVFDFCFGASAYFQKKFAKIGDKLSALARQGTEVFFFEGNHEFFLSCLNWEGVRFVEERELAIDLGLDERLVLSHGDRLYGPWHYHLYLRFVRSALAKNIARAISPAFFDKFCLGLAARSRKGGGYKNVNHRAITSALSKWANAFPQHHAVVGHFHAPYHLSKPERDGRIFCLESWDRPNCLTFQDGNFSRLYINCEGATVPYADVSLMAKNLRFLDFPFNK